MRKGLFSVALAALAGALVISCVTSPPRALTVEIYDSSSAAGQAGAGGIADFPLPVPLVPGAPPAFLSTAASSADDGASADVVGLTGQRVPRATSGFPLVQPEVPAVAPTARIAPAPRGTPAASPQPKSGSSQQQTAAPAVTSRAAAPTGSPSAASRNTTAGSSAGSGTSAPSVGTASTTASTGRTSPAAASGSSADSYGRLREIYARVGDEMQIGLDGAGFLFLGFPDKQAQSDGMSFKTKEIRSGKTWFTFQALKLGTYDLDFLQQDNASGTSERETVRVHVLNDQDFSAAVSQSPVAGSVGGSAAETGDPAFADKLTGFGAYEAAVVELLKGYQDGNAALNDQIAGLYVRMGSYDAAGTYYQKNLSLGGPFADAAVLGLVRVAAALKDQTALISRLKRFLAIRDPAGEEPLILAVRMERDQGQVGVGLDLAAEYTSRYPQGRWRDEAEFIAAQFLEADSPFRDIARARDLYRDVVSRYPVGDFAAAARGRLQYIERHFFQIR